MKMRTQETGSLTFLTIKTKVKEPMMNEHLYTNDAAATRDKWLHETIENSALVGIVIFKGSWCVHDKDYLQRLGEYCKTQEEEVKLVAWTSQGQEGADLANKEWCLTEDYGYSLVLGDKSNELANWLKEEYILPDISIVTRLGYPNGMVLPAQVWYAHHGNPVIEWCLQEDGPERPKPESVLSQARKRKHALDLGHAVAPSHAGSIPLVYIGGAEERKPSSLIS